MELSSTLLSQFLIFQEMELFRHMFLLYFRRELSKLEKQKKSSLKKFLYSLIFREMELSSSNIKKDSLIFQEMELSSPK